MSRREPRRGRLPEAARRILSWAASALRAALSQALPASPTFPGRSIPSGPCSFGPATVRLAACRVHHERQGVTMVVRSRRDGFTLIELLIGLSILTTLGVLFLPAIQSARESSRLATCRNHISQLSKGMLQHEHFQGYFPSAGWSPSWLGVADRTGDSAQPGGWAYDILPYIDETATRNLVAKIPAGGQAAFLVMTVTTLPKILSPRAFLDA